MAAEAVGVRRIAQVAITVKDVERARAFYRDVLGLRHLFDAPPKMSFFQCGDIRLLLGEAEETAPPAHSSTIVYLEVPDIRAAHAILAERGAGFDAEPHHVADLGDRDLWLAFVRDGEGNVVGLMSEVPKAADDRSE